MTDKKLRSGEDSIVQKQAGKAVRERQTRFRRISAITSDIAYSCHTQKDGRFSIDWMTGAADRITGYSTQEIKAHGCWRFLVVEEDIPLFEKSVIGLAPGSRGSCELRIRHKNGGVVWISSFAECVAEAKIPGRLLYGGLTEITARKHAEEMLSASETLYRHLFEAAKDGILILDADTGMIMDVNPFLTEMLGFSREEFLGKHIWNLGFFKGIVANEADFLKLQQKEYIRYEDVALETADGRRINVEFISNLCPVGQAKVIQCSMRRAHLASFPAQDPSPVVEVGIDGAVRYANPAAMATLGRLGLDPDARQFLPGTPEELALLRSQCERNPQTQELRLGKASFLRVVAAPPGGDSLHVYLVDITERKQAEEELRESRKLLSETEKTAHIGGWVFDAEKLTQEWTEETFRILEIDVTKSEPKVPQGVEFIAPAFRPMADEGIRRAIEFGEPYDQEWEVITAKGNRRWVRVVAKAYQEQGKTKRVSGSFQDITERKQAEEALRQSEAKYRLLIDTASESIVVAQDGLLKFVNPAALDLLGGYSEQEVINRPFPEFIHPDDRSMVVENYRRRIADEAEQPPRYAFRVVTRDGIVKWVEINAALIEWEGKPATLNLLTDITDRKRAEEALRESEERLRDITSSMADWVWEVDASGVYTYSSAKGCNLLARFSQDVIGKTPFDFMQPDEARRVSSLFAEIVAKRTPIKDLENWNIGKDGEEICLLTNGVPILDKEGSLLGYRGVDKDITERKRTEDKLRVAQLQWNQFLEASPDPMWIKDTSGRYVAANKTYYRVEPSAEGNIIGKTDAECFPPEKAAAYVADDRVAIENGVSEGEFTAVDVDGKFHNFLTKKVVLRGPDGSVAGTLGISRDITDRKRAADALRESEERLREVLENSLDASYKRNLQTDTYDYLSSVFAKITGYTPDELKTLPHETVLRMTHPDDRAEIERVIAKAMSSATGTEYQVEYRLKHKEGQYRWVQDRFTVMRDAGGQPLARIGSVRDITERKRAEEENQRERAFFDQLVETAPEGVAITGEEGKVLRVNAEFVRMFGYEANEAVGQCIDDLVVPPALQEEARAMTTSAGQGKTNLLETVRRRKDGTLLDVSIIGAPVLIAGKQEAIYAIYRDITERKQAEEALRQSEERLRDITSSMADWVWEVDASGVYTYSSAKGCNLLARFSQDVIGKTPFDFMQPDEARRVSSLFAEIVAKRTPIKDLENWNIGKDGEEICLLTNGVPILDKDGSLLGYRGVDKDITERKRAEDKLRVAQLQWNQFLDASPDPMWIKDTSGRYVAANKIYCLTDASVNGDIIGKTDAECFPPEKAAAYVAGDRVAIEKGTTESEFTSVGIDGKIRYFLDKKAVLRATDGSVAGTLGISRDITERKKMEQALQESEMYARTILAGINTGFVLVDAESHVIVDANRAAIAMLHATKESVLGAVCHSFICPAERGKCPISDLGQTIDNSQRVLLSLRGDRIPIIKSVFSVILHDHSYLLESFVDISDRVRAEADKEAMQVELRQSQKMEAIGELAGGVAHDFNNLLTGILGNIALMRGSLPSADPLLENLNAAETAARQAATLTKGLLTFSRSAMVLPIPMSITAALDTTLALLKQSLPATMGIIRDDEQPAWNVLMDQSQITQILLNLAVNARDAMQGEGILTIRTRNVVVGEEYVHTYPFARTGEFVHLSVTDTGSGMSEEVMQHLFEPFYTTKPVGSGTGLGLSVVYGAVKQAGGWITAVSTEGAGATLNIYLPRCLEESTRLSAPTSIPVRIGSGTILVVEDEPVVCAVAQALLSRSGYTVLTAPDGASALNALREHPTDIGLILLDMTMPGMRTSDIVQAVRALDPTVPILLTSGYTSNGTIKQMVEEGSVQGFLGKPYELHQLLENVQRLLRRG